MRSYKWVLCNTVYFPNNNFIICSLRTSSLYERHFRTQLVQNFRTTLAWNSIATKADWRTDWLTDRQADYWPSKVNGVAERRGRPVQPPVRCIQGTRAGAPPRKRSSKEQKWNNNNARAVWGQSGVRKRVGERKRESRVKCARQAKQPVARAGLVPCAGQ